MGNNKQSKLYIDLAEILKTERTYVKKSQVEDILAQELPLNDKIKLIKAIDNENGTMSPSSHSLETQLASVTRSIEQEYSQYTHASEAIHSRQVIKRNINRVGYFTFLFSECQKIIKFLKKTKQFDEVLGIHWVPPGFKIHQDTSTLFTNHYISYAQELVPFLDKLLECGWRHIAKFDYNLVLIFREMCVKLAEINTRLFITETTFAIDHLLKFEMLYLTCHYDSYYADKIFEALTAITKKYPEWRFNSQKMVSYSRKLLLENWEKPSLYNVVLSLNIVRYGRLLRYSDLMSKRNMAVIQNFDFECDSSTRGLINDYLDAQENRLVQYLNDKRDIVRFEKFIPRDGLGNINYHVLQIYYEAKREGRILSFSQHAEAVPLLVFNLYSACIYFFEEFLTGKVMFEEFSEQRIFTKDCFQFEVDKMKMLIEKLNRLKYSFKNITSERFLALKHSPKNAIAVELDVIHVIENLTESSRTIAERMIDIEKFNVVDESLESISAIEPAMLLQKSVSIPRFRDSIDGPGILKGLSVHHVINDIISFSLLASLYLKDTAIAQMLSRREKLESDIKKIHDNIQRVANAKRYSDFAKKTGILNDEP